MKEDVMPTDTTHAAPHAAELAVKAKDVARMLKNLAHPQRLLVLCRLSQSEANVSQLQELLQVEQAVMSQMLARLRGQGLVIAEKRGQQVFYRLADARIAQVLATLTHLYCEDLEGGTR
jgi:ArsR family transcriptional regulator, virulence genes transcriptional regulator